MTMGMVNFIVYQEELKTGNLGKLNQLWIYKLF